MSGTIPLSVNGMSSAGHSRLKMPFWPCRLANLSPIVGFRGTLSVMHTHLKFPVPVSLLQTLILSTTQTSLFLENGKEMKIITLKAYSKLGDDLYSAPHYPFKTFFFRTLLSMKIPKELIKQTSRNLYISFQELVLQTVVE